MPEPTNLSDAELRAIAERALPHWGLRPERIELVSRSENTVFRLDMAEGKQHVLRIHRPGYHSLAELESELVWTEALNEAGIHAPVGRRTNDGRGYVTIATPDGASSRAVGLVDWIDGELLYEQIAAEDDATRLGHHFEQLGRIAAAIHNQSAGWSAPEAFTRHSFDVPGYFGDAPFWGRFWEIPTLTLSQRATLSRARERIAAILSDYGQRSETYSMIHADLHAANILVDADGALHVFDFDDAGFGWHQYELAVALYGHEHQPYFDAISEGLVAGYRSLRVFADGDLELLPLFVLIRRLVLLSWVWDRPELGRREDLAQQIEKACERVEAFSF